MFAYTNVAIATSYLFSQFWGGGGSMPPFSLRMVMPVASHLKANMQVIISVLKVAKGGCVV